MSEVAGELLEAVLARPNMQQAWLAVEANDGSAGVDRMSIEATRAHLVQHWPGIAEKLRAGKYKPAAVRAVRIPKPNGGERQLGIPTVQDRLIQQGMLLQLSPLFEARMSAHSYGFRPGRSAHDAVQAARGHVLGGKRWVVDIDLKSFFDQVDHDKLMHMVGQVIRDKLVLKLIGSYLRAPMQHPDGRRELRTRGTPQGGPLSPLLANIYLTPLDEELERRGIAFVRYADDIQLYAGSERAARQMLENISAWLLKHLKLEVNVDKSGSGPSDQTQLLGFSIDADGETRVSDKALKRLKARVREFWTARQSEPLAALKQRWSQYIDGWWNYFSHASWTRNVSDLSGWIRRHMRKFLWLRWHGVQGRRKALWRLGIRGDGLNLASSSCGAWPIAKSPVIHQALNNQSLTTHGYTLPWAPVSTGRRKPSRHR
jgi:RNA-directed DNA polymerase